MKNITTKIALVSLLAGASLFATPTNLDPTHSKVGFSVKHLMITNTTISDIDSSLSNGMYIELNITCNHGHLIFPNINIISQEIYVYVETNTITNNTNTIYRLYDTINNINNIINNIKYSPPMNWYGVDNITWNLNDKGNIGYSNTGNISLTDTKFITVTVNSVDDPFTLTTPLNAYFYEDEVNEPFEAFTLEVNVKST